MIYKKKQLVLAIFVAIVSMACIVNQAETDGKSSEKPLPNEMTEKWKLLQKFTSFKAVPLEVTKTFILNDEQLVNYPASLTTSGDRHIYLSDNNGHKIFNISSDSELPIQFSKERKDSDESLKYPNTIKIYREKIFVSDNDGIKVFNKSGEFEKTLRVYYSINSFTIDSKGDFFINPNFLEPNQENPLIIKLDKNGTRTGEIGQITNSAEYNGLEGNAYVETSDKYIILAYKHLPLVKIFDSENGRLIRKIKVEASIFDELGKLKENKEFVNPRKGINVLPRYVAGLKVLQNKIFLLLHLPHPEIVVLNFQGKEIIRFRAEELRESNYFGFDIRLVGDEYQFIVGAIELSQRPTIIEFNENKKEVLE